MKTQREQTNPENPRRTKRAPASADQMMIALGGDPLRTVTSGSYDDDDCTSGDLGGFHFSR